VEQEFYALLLAHAAIRTLMTTAAKQTSQASEDLSFIHAVQGKRSMNPVLPPER
jgi:hypothetical protein